MLYTIARTSKPRRRRPALGRRPAAAPAAAAAAEPAAKPKVSGEELLTKVLLPIAMELNLPIALKARRCPPHEPRS